MNSKTIFKGTLVALCLISMLVLPAAAVTGQTATAKGNAIDQGLKDDLWANHQQHRLQQFDANVQRANSVIAILNKYGVDTTTCQATLSTITSDRSALETALSAKDRASLKTVNNELKTLWQQFRTEMKDAVKAKYGTRSLNGPAHSGAAGSANLTIEVPALETE